MFDDDDDWLFDSVKIYKNLSMYDMQQPITAMEWIDDRSLCIATSSGRKHELLELLLPDKMLEDDSSSKKAKSDRDFRVHTGGFSPHKVEDIKHVSGTRLCVAAGQDNQPICVWQMGSETTDLMKEVKQLHCTSSSNLPARVSVRTGGGSSPSLAFGSRLDNISLVDLDTYQKIQDLTDVKDTDQITSLFHKDTNTLLCCTSAGDIVDLDLRCKNAKVTRHKHHGSSASFWKLAIQTDQSDLCNLLQMSSDGEILVFDPRFTDDCVRRFQLRLNTSKDYEYLTCQWCSQSGNGQKISVSGFNGLVYIYNLASVQTESDGLEPVFIHEGHVRNCDSQSDPPMVVKHLWHPWQQDLILSAATDGSLHAWQYNVKST